MTTKTADEARRVFRHLHPNMLTPGVLAYGWADDLAWELSIETGPPFWSHTVERRDDGGPKVAVSYLRADARRADPDPSHLIGEAPPYESHTWHVVEVHGFTRPGDVYIVTDDELAELRATDRDFSIVLYTCPGGRFPS